jgi:hypothetical protein
VRGRFRLEKLFTAPHADGSQRGGV